MSDDPLEQLRDYLRQVQEDKQQAIEEQDTEGAAYAAGKASGLIAGIEALEGDSDE